MVMLCSRVFTVEIDVVSVVRINNALTAANFLDRYAGSTNHHSQYDYG
jgi:hypothetical protein